MQWENVYIFISSTFNDMHAERDYLVKRVFPQLSAWCEERKLRLVDIDLRWGVSEADATENKRVVQVCLDRIDACRPFFLCFLGQRRGWVPDECDIGEGVYKNFPKLLEKRYSGNASVTEMEILHALIDPLHGGLMRLADGGTKEANPVDYAFFFLRDPGYLDAITNPDTRKVYTNDTDADPARADAELQRWRNEIIPGTGRPVSGYFAEWRDDESTPEIALPFYVPTTAPQDSGIWQAAFTKWARAWADKGVMVGEGGEITDTQELAKATAYNQIFTGGRLGGFNSGGEELADIIIEQLKAAITERFGERAEQAQTPLQRELDQQAQFLQTASEGFIERVGDFDELDAYIQSPDTRPFGLTAYAGMGKTSLLAHFIDTYRPEAENETLHYRFVGGSDDSVSAERLLRSLLKELKERGKLSSDIPADTVDMLNKLPDILGEAGKFGKTLIVIDALNQLQGSMTDLSWIPSALPENVKMIVSFKRGDEDAEEYYERQERDQTMLLVSVKPFDSMDDRKKLVEAYLDQYFKELDEPRINALIGSGGANNPLFLKVALSELRVFGVHNDLSEMIKSNFGNSPVTAFNAVLARMENDPAYTAISPAISLPHVFGWLAHSKYGLSVKELADLLVRENLTDSESNAKDAVYLIVRQLRPYLAKRDGRVDFFYESFKIAATERYTGAYDYARSAAEWHRSLAEYFETLPLENRHRLMEQAWQYACAGLGEELKTLLWSYCNLDARLQRFDINTLIEDYNNIYLIEDWPAGEIENLELLKNCLNISAFALNSDKSQLAGQLWGRLGEVSFAKQLLSEAAEEKKKRSEVWLRPTDSFLASPDPCFLTSFPIENPLSMTSIPGQSALIVAQRSGVTGINGTTSIYDGKTGKFIRKIYDFCVSCPYVIDDGGVLIATAGYLGVVLYDLKNMREIARFKIKEEYQRIDISEGEKYFVVSTKKDNEYIYSLDIYEIAKLEKIGTLCPEKITGNRPFVRTGDGIVSEGDILYNDDTIKVIKNIMTSKDDKYLYINYEGSIIEWDIENNLTSRVLKTNAYNADGLYLSDDDAVLNIINLRGDRVKRMKIALTSPEKQDAGYNVDNEWRHIKGGYLSGSSMEHTVVIMSGSAYLSKNIPDFFSSLHLSEDRKRFYTICGGCIGIWKPDESTFMSRTPKETETVLQKIQLVGGRLLSIYRYKRFAYLDIRNGQPKLMSDELGGQIKEYLYFAEQNAIVAVESQTNACKLVDAATLKVIRTYGADNMDDEALFSSGGSTNMSIGRRRDITASAKISERCFATLDKGFRVRIFDLDQELPLRVADITPPEWEGYDLSGIVFAIDEKNIGVIHNRTKTGDGRVTLFSILYNINVVSGEVSVLQTFDKMKILQPKVTKDRRIVFISNHKVIIFNIIRRDYIEVFDPSISPITHIEDENCCVYAYQTIDRENIFGVYDPIQKIMVKLFKDAGFFQYKLDTALLLTTATLGCIHLYNYHTCERIATFDTDAYVVSDFILQNNILAFLYRDKLCSLKIENLNGVAEDSETLLEELCEPEPAIPPIATQIMQSVTIPNNAISFTPRGIASVMLENGTVYRAYANTLVYSSGRYITYGIDKDGSSLNIIPFSSIVNLEISDRGTKLLVEDDCGEKTSLVVNNLFGKTNKLMFMDSEKSHLGYAYNTTDIISVAIDWAAPAPPLKDYFLVTFEHDAPMVVPLNVLFSHQINVGAAGVTTYDIQFGPLLENPPQIPFAQINQLMITRTYDMQPTAKVLPPYHCYDVKIELLTGDIIENSFSYVQCYHGIEMYSVTDLGLAQFDPGKFKMIQKIEKEKIDNELHYSANPSFTEKHPSDVGDCL